jgi:uncharacterized membrane protein
MSYNPYQSPETNVAGTDSYSAAQTEATPAVMQDLQSTFTWVRVFGVVSIIGLVLSLYQLLQMPSAGGRTIAGWVQVAIQSFLTFKIWQYGTSLSHYLKTPNPEKLREAFAHHRVYWLTMGILIIIVMAFILIGLVAGMSARPRIRY